MRPAGLTSLLLLALRGSGPLLTALARVTRAPASEPQPLSQWEREYASGHWNFLHDLRETAHYHVIAGYQEKLCPGGAILDVGCGEGILHRLLRRAGYARYLGLDVSAEAIAKARANAGPPERGTDFIVADAERFETQERFDAVIVNEALYYFNDPPAAVRRLIGLLRPAGVLILCVAPIRWRDGLGKLATVRAAEHGHVLVDEVSLHTQGGPTWVIRVLRPARPHTRSDGEHDVHAERSAAQAGN